MEEVECNRRASYGFKIMQPFDDFGRRDRVVLVSESLIEFGLESGFGFGIQGQVVGDSAGGAETSVR